MTGDAPALIGKRTAIGAGWMIAWRMVTRSLGMVSTLVLARLLVPADFGLVAMATAFSASIDAFSTLGLQEALIRRKDPDRGLYDTAFTMQAMRGLLTAGILAVGASSAGTWFEEPRLFPILLILAATAAMAGFENIAIVEYRRALVFSMDFKLLFMPRICQFVVTIAVASTLRSYWALVIGIVSAKLVRLVMTYVLHPYRPKLALLRWRELVGFSFWTWATAMVLLVWERLDPFVIGPMFGPALLGTYILSAEIALLPLSELVQPASGALFAGVAAARQQGTDTTSMALPIASALLLMVMPMAIGFSGTSGYIVAGLLGPKWTAAQPLIAICSWMCIFSTLSSVGSTVLVAAGHVRQNFQVIAGASAMKLLLVGGAVLTHDLNAFAWTCIGCTGTEAVLYFFHLRACGMKHVAGVTGGIVRLLVSSAVSSGALFSSGYGWCEVTLPSVQALIDGILIGCGTIGVFAAVQLTQWQCVGRPPGPEARLIEVARQFLGRRIGRRFTLPTTS